MPNRTYRQRAADCRKIADALHGIDREDWESLAEKWEALALSEEELADDEEQDRVLKATFQERLLRSRNGS